MNAIRGIFRSGQLEMDSRPDWPEGTEVLIEPTLDPEERIGINESQWSDDPGDLKDWGDWIKTVNPPEFTEEEKAQTSEFEEIMRLYNLESVSRAMQRGTPE